jgi:hypothetical protein
VTTYDEYVAWLIEHDRARKKSAHPQVPNCQNCQKPENHPFVSFDSTPPGASENFTCPSTVATWWRIYRDGEPLCIVMQPGGLTAAEALKGARERWPGFRIEVGR